MAFFLVSIAVGGLFLDSLVSRRLATLAAAADRLGSGHYDAELPPASRDEVGRLSESFGAMRQRILENMSSLDEARA